MKNPVLIPEIKELLKKRRFKLLQAFLEEGHAKEIAEYIELLTVDEIWKVLSFIELQRRVEVFSYLSMDVQVQMVSGPGRKNVRELLLEMSHDDRADLFQHLDKDIADKLLIVLPVTDRRDVIQLTSYAEQTAGAIMTTDYALLNENDTVEKGIRKIRREAPSKETIYYIYVTDDDNKLIGFVSLRKLIVARPKQKIADIMRKDMIFAHTFDDRETAVKLIDEYDLIALPVVDRDARLAGIITYDDAIDTLVEEQTEDMEKLMAISPTVEHRPYLDEPAGNHFKKRVFWVVVLGVFGLLTSSIIEHFHTTLQALIALTFYMPLLNAAGGNTGSQSATVILRALTLNQVTFSDIFKVIKKEFTVSVLLSLCLGIITFGRVLLFSSGTTIPASFTLINVAMVVSFSLALQVIWSTVFGAIIPVIATRLKIDPAVVSSPFLTTFVDMGGIIIYFTMAKIILGI